MTENKHSYVNLEWDIEFKKIIKDLDVPNGDFVECGSFTGNSASTLSQKCNGTIYLFDSWEGVSEVGEFDNPLYKDFNWKASIDLCKYNLSSHDNVSFYKGWIPSRFNEIADRQISLLHLDLSLYQPTRDSLEFFWDRIIPGGWVITNFHEGYSYGAEKAVRDFFNNIRKIEPSAQGVCLIQK